MLVCVHPWSASDIAQPARCSSVCMQEWSPFGYCVGFVLCLVVQAAIIPDITHYLVVFITMVIMFASVFVIAFGTRIGQVASLDVGLVNILQYALLG